MKTMAAKMLRPVQRRAFSSSPRRLDKYGFIGLGQMGYQMAKNLQSKLSLQDSFSVFDINRRAIQSLTADVKASEAGGAGITMAETALAASEDADVVITVLPEPSHVKAVYKSILPPSALPPPNRRRFYIDCSTIDPSTSRQVAKVVHARFSGGATFVDAPMSGGVVGATAGTLTFMVGCEEQFLPPVEQVLLKMGKRALLCGEQGTGLSAKLANNYLLAVNNIATAEAMNLGIRWGLEPKTLAAILNASTGKCWPSEVNNPVPGVVETAPASRDYSGGFGVSLMRKDISLAVKAAKEAGANLRLGDEAMKVYEGAEKDERCKGRDFSVVYRYMDGKE